MSESSSPRGRSGRLEAVLSDLLRQSPELDAAAVVSFDGLPMASALPSDMDEDRVAAMSAALLSLGERAAAGLGRGDLNQVYIEGEHGTVFLVSADGEAVLVAVASRTAKAGLVLFELRRAAASVAALLAEGASTDSETAAEAREPEWHSPTPIEAGPPVMAVPMQAVPAAVPVYAEPVSVGQFSHSPLTDPYAQTPAAEQLASWTSYSSGGLPEADPAAGSSWA